MPSPYRKSVDKRFVILLVVSRIEVAVWAVMAVVALMGDSGFYTSQQSETLAEFFVVLLCMGIWNLLILRKNRFRADAFHKYVHLAIYQVMFLAIFILNIVEDALHISGDFGLIKAFGGTLLSLLVLTRITDLWRTSWEKKERVQKVLVKKNRHRVVRRVER